MNDDQTLQQRLEQLGRELAGTFDLPQAVMAQIHQRHPAGRTVSIASRRPDRSRWRVPAAIAAAVMLCVGTWWLSRPANLYARMLTALADAKSIHVTGWTRHIVRKWPLEGSPEISLAERWPDGKYPIEMWHWTDADGKTRSYERAGPVILVRRGGDSKEHQEDADLTCVYEGGSPKDRVDEFGGVGKYFESLQRASLKKEDLGAREEVGRKLRGIRHIERNCVEELWIDETTNLPVRLTRKTSIDAEPTIELIFTANEPVPGAIASYMPPATKHVRYAGGSRTNEAWLQHVAEVSERLQSQPLSGRIAIWPRSGGRLFANQWAVPIAEGTYWIRPLDLDEHFRLSLDNFIRLVAKGEGEQRHGTWRIPKELHNLQFPRADLIHAADVGWQEWLQFALGQLGLEYVDEAETQTVWIAKHDGRPLKPWQQVNPPVSYVVESGKERKGDVRPGVGFALRPTTMQELFADFNQMIDSHDLAADKPRIINQTNLPTPPPFDPAKHGTPQEFRETVVSKFFVATDSPWFVGRESVDIARQWYEKEFGITFTVESRLVTVHVVRRKQSLDGGPTSR